MSATSLHSPTGQPVLTLKRGEGAAVINGVGCTLATDVSVFADDLGKVALFRGSDRVLLLENGATVALAYLLTAPLVTLVLLAAEEQGISVEKVDDAAKWCVSAMSGIPIGLVWRI